MGREGGTTEERLHKGTLHRGLAIVHAPFRNDGVVRGRLVPDPCAGVPEHPLPRKDVKDRGMSSKFVE